MTRDAASAPGGRTGTVRSMTVAATTRYQQLIDALLAQASERETALLLLCATSLARHWELLHPETMLDRGVLHVPRTATNGLVIPGRQIVLPPTLTEKIRDVRGTVHDLLGLNGRRVGAMLEKHFTAAAQLEVRYGISIEGLFVVHLEASSRQPPPSASCRRSCSLPGSRVTPGASTASARVVSAPSSPG